MKLRIRALLVAFAIGRMIAGQGAQAADLAAMLPPEPLALDAIRAHPRVLEADAGLARERAASERLRLGEHETQIELGSQRRSPGEGRGAEIDWSVAFARPIRLPSKRDADVEIGRRALEYGDLAAQDARHETARMLVGRWFEWLRQEVVVAQTERQVELLVALADLVGRRIRAGDAARLEQVQSEAALGSARAQLRLARQRAELARIALVREFPDLARSARPGLDEAAGALVEPPGSSADWVRRIVSVDHELGMQRAQLAVLKARAQRVAAERTPDPTIGIRASTDRGREERVLGVFVSIPFAGGARVAAQREAIALAEEGEARLAAAERRVIGTAESAYASVRAGASAWRSLADALEQVQAASTLSARAFELGEGTMTEVLFSRRAVLDARLAERTAWIDALEAQARLLLDAHELWEHEEHAGARTETMESRSRVADNTGATNR